MISLSVSNDIISSSSMATFFMLQNVVQFSALLVLSFLGGFNSPSSLLIFSRNASAMSLKFCAFNFYLLSTFLQNFVVRM